MAMSVYKYLEAFAKLEKRLSEGLEGSAATKGQPSLQEVRHKLDRFIRALGPREIQVWVPTRVTNYYCAYSCTWESQNDWLPPTPLFQHLKS